MKERPILFSGPMVRALLAGTKTQTRRVVREQGCIKDRNYGIDCAAAFGPDKWPWSTRHRDWISCPYGHWMDRLWVRETWCQKADLAPGKLLDGQAHYAADGYEVRHVDEMHRSPWRPSIYMPRWASRITLDVTGVSVERVQDISGEDAIAEGISNPRCFCIGGTLAGGMCPAHRSAVIAEYASLWDKINGKRAPWSSNPWVFVIYFRRIPSGGREG